MVDVNRDLLIARYKQLKAEINRLETMLWQSTSPRASLSGVRDGMASLLEKIDTLDEELVAIEKLLPDFDVRVRDSERGD